MDALRSMPAGATPTRKLAGAAPVACSSRTTQEWTSVLEYSRTPRTVAWPMKGSSTPMDRRLAALPSCVMLTQGDARWAFHLREAARSRNMALECRVMESMMLSRDT
jgi:hypothetical protein